MTERIAILTLSDISSVQGSTEIYYVSNHLAASRDVVVYSPFDPDIASAEHRSVPRAKWIPRLVHYNLLLLPSLLISLLKNDFDVVYSYKTILLPPCLLSTVTDTEWIIDLRTKPTEQDKEFNSLTRIGSVYYAFFDYLYRVTLHQASAVGCISEPVANHMINRYNVDESKLFVLPSGVDSERFTPSFHSTEQPIDLVYLGSIADHRDFETIIDALASEKLSAQVRFHLIGSGDESYLDNLQATIHRRGISDAVIWHGFKDHDEVPRVLSEMDVAISPLPPLDSYRVSSPAKLYEYLAVGLPILCTDIRPHRELLTESEICYFYTANDPESLVSQLNRLGNFSTDDWLNMRQTARQIGEENDWECRLRTIDREIRSLSVAE